MGELSSYDNHPADQGTETFEREKDWGLRQDTLFFLGEVKDALRRLDRGRFGVCERCGGPIGEARLAVVPWARRCVDCADAEGLPGRSRPVEEEVLKPPFGRSRGNRGIPGVDGEDVWQALESYGSSDTPQDDPPARDYQDLTKNAGDAGVVQEVEGMVDASGDPLQSETRGVRPD